jgi:hypothetical protein
MNWRNTYDRQKPFTNVSTAAKANQTLATFASAAEARPVASRIANDAFSRCAASTAEPVPEHHENHATLSKIKERHLWGMTI